MPKSTIVPVPFERVSISEGFWSRRIDTNSAVTARVCLEQCEKTGRIDNFRRAAGRKEGAFEGKYYNDSDVYKVLEGIAFMLHGQPDAYLAQAAESVIDDICAVQRGDGYLDTYFILAEPGHEWTNTVYHEAYCLGHMIEAALAYCQATGNDRWLNTAIRAVRQMMLNLGPGKRHWVTGCEEIELALVKLYRHTGDKSFLEYAQWLIDERGHGYAPPRCDLMPPAYCQDDVPAREITHITGHAVRAMYYYSVITDLSAVTGEEALKAAMLRAWDSVQANLYITGGIGQSASNEGFTRDWSLPNLTAYCETCASIGMALWNQRMFLLTGEARYADLVEKAMYNGVLSGVSLTGDVFFYVNPLSSVGNHHRQPWYETSCCPTNIVRFLPSVGGYAYAAEGQTVYVNQYIPGAAEVDIASGAVGLTVETGYPWSGRIKFRIEKGEAGFALKLRVPGWCDGLTLSVNGEHVDAAVEQGYVTAKVQKGSEVVLDLDMPVRLVRADPRVREDEGRVAVTRGPLVYCAEECDNPGFVSEYYPAEIGVSVSAPCRLTKADGLPEDTVAIAVGDRLLIPYALWDNRTPGAMAVWLKEQP